MTRYRVGVDIGGTFTDLAFLGEHGERLTKKVSSTVDNYATAIVDGLAELIRERGLDDAEIVELLHGTTVASNAILELKGARTGLITTKGFRDVLEIRTLRMPRLYDLAWTKPPPLVERHLRVEVDERVNAKGEVERPLAEADVARAIEKLIDERVEAIAVCLIHSYLNPAHEQLVKRVAARMAPDVTLCISSEVLPEIKEYERTSTTVINAYVKPTVEKYLSTLTAELARIGVDAPLLLMQSNGGLTTAKAAALTPMNIIESGPAAGVVGVQALIRQIGIAKAISFDMGGTTAKASLIENGELSRAPEYSVVGGVMIGSRLLSGAGYTLRVPAIDLAEVGAGGGSVIWIDAGGALKLNASKARSVIAEKVARPLGMTVEEAAWGAHLIAGSNMIRGIKAVSSERGRDPRDYALVAFGGNGPLFAAVMAAALTIRRVVIPPSAGVFSSYGLLYSEVAYHFTKTRKALLGAIDPAEIGAILGELEGEARARLAEDGFVEDRIAIERAAALHYQGQSFELEVPVLGGVIDRAVLSALEEAFGVEHERTYGHRAGAEEPVELVTLKVVGRGFPDMPHAALAAKADLPANVLISQPCGRPSSVRSMAGATLMSSTVPISTSLAEGPASSRNTMQPASSHPARPRASTTMAILLSMCG